MDTGYVNLLTPEERGRVLEVARTVLNGQPFVAGAFIEGEEGDPLVLYARELERVQKSGGTPILFQCSALQARSDAEIIELYSQIAENCDRLLAFELGQSFAAFGQIYSLRVVEGLMRIPRIAGLKHSSLDRKQEWQRLELRDRVRPEFKIFTGNDLAIDMVMYGSDYLLGLAAFAPDVFARRDAAWAACNPVFYELNDALQYLGRFAFRSPVPAYRHSAAQFLRLRGFIASDAPHPRGARRPASDVDVLREIADSLGLR
jgi:dihydrodipicolinate synthase/N-acetylneuraminate lyase